MNRFLRLTKGMAKNKDGLHLLRLALWVDNKEIDHVVAISGAPGYQHFRLAIDSYPGSLEPIPEGYYSINPYPFWANGIDNYADTFSPALGSVVVDIEPAGDNRRSELRIHADANQDYAPGTAGCVGIQGEEGPKDFRRLRQVLSWLAKYAPKKMVVDYGLKSVGRPW